MKARLSAVLLLALTAVGFTVVPAYAAAPPTPEIGTLDSSAAGHVTGTVTTAAGFVRVGIRSDELTQIATSGGSASFDLPTWGYGAASIHAIACPASDSLEVECSTFATKDFTATDVRPTVTFTTDSTLGPNQLVGINTTDPVWAGRLRAVWNTEGDLGSAQYKDLIRSGDDNFAPREGSGTLHVMRCSATYGADCVDFTPPITKTMSVQTSFPINVTPNPVQDITATKPSTSFQVAAPGRTGTYVLSWNAQRNDGLSMTSGEATGTLGAGGTIPAVTINGADLADGSFKVRGSLSVTDPDYGTFSGELTPTPFEVRRTKPTVDTATSSRSTIYPNVNTTGFPASTQLSFQGMDTTFDYDVVIRNSAGTEVRRLNAALANDFVTFTATWNGRNAAGTVVPAGAYKAYLVDDWANDSTRYASVTVNPKKLVLKTYTATVSAAGSTDDRFVGRCSTLRRPSLRGWAGSLGYYSGNKCGSTANQADAALTINSVRVPAAAAYKDVRVSVYGGAAKAKPRSIGVVQYMTTGGDFVNGKAISAAMGSHPGVLRSASGMIFSDRYFVWSFGTVRGSRYDVKNFTVTVHYYVLA